MDFGQRIGGPCPCGRGPVGHDCEDAKAQHEAWVKQIEQIVSQPPPPPRAGTIADIAGGGDKAAGIPWEDVARDCARAAERNRARVAELEAALREIASLHVTDGGVAGAIMMARRALEPKAGT